MRALRERVLLYRKKFGVIILCDYPSNAESLLNSSPLARSN